MATTVSTSRRTENHRDLLTPEQVAEILKVTPRTVRRWGAAGVLERVRIGSRVTRYRACDVDALINRVSPAGQQGSHTTPVAVDDGYAPD